MSADNRPDGAPAQGDGNGPERMSPACSGWALRLWSRLAGIAGIVAVLALFPTGDSLAAEAAESEPEEPPSVEMLEFLGDWQTGDGGWFDPTEKELPQESKPQQRDKREEQDHG